MTNSKADELRKRYDKMTRNLSLEQIAEVEASGPLSDDDFMRRRQGAYRAWLAESSGVVFASNPARPMHHPA